MVPSSFKDPGYCSVSETSEVPSGASEAPSGASEASTGASEDSNGKLLVIHGVHVFVFLRCQILMPQI